MKKNTPFTPSDKINGCQSEEKRWGVTPLKHPLFTLQNTPSAPPPAHRARRSICHPHRLLKGLNIPNCASPRMVNRFSIFTPICCCRNCRIKEPSHDPFSGSEQSPYLCWQEYVHSRVWKSDDPSVWCSTRYQQPLEYTSSVHPRSPRRAMYGSVTNQDLAHACTKFTNCSLASWNVTCACK